MGTRSLTHFVQKYDEERTEIVTMYRQYDGYPKGHGLELAEFLASGTMVDGFSLEETGIVFNGIGCLAAQVIAHFKDGVGGFYLYRGGKTDCGEEYIYDVIYNENTRILTMTCYDVYEGKMIFEGLPQDFVKRYGEMKVPETLA